MTPQELKNSILQLAIQGKLVEQRPEEGTAAELVEKILATKNTKSTKVGSRVPRDRNGRAVAPRPPIPDDEKPFDIPESWEWVRLGEAGSWASGTTPSRTHAEYFGGSIPWLKTGDLTDGYVSSIPESITELALEKTSLRLNPVGSVLMAMYGATIGKLGILQIAATTNQACCACIPYDGVWNEYLFYYLMARRSAFIKMGEGGAQPNISKEKIVNALIPLPPLAEQKRIVAKIEELLPLIDRYEKAWSKLEDFSKRFPVDMQKSLLQMAIQGKLVDQRPEDGTAAELLEKILAAKNAKGNLTRSRGTRGEKETSALSASPREKIPDDEKPFDIPESWKWVRLGDIGAIVTGATPNKSESDLYGGQYPFYKPAELDQGYNVIHAKETLSDVGWRKARRLSVGSVLVTCIGATIGKTGIIRREGSCNQQINAIIPYEVVPEYLYYVIISAWFQSVLKADSSRTTLPIMKKSKFENLMIPLPPIAEQKRIVAKLEEILPLCERLKSSHGSLSDLLSR